MLGAIYFNNQLCGSAVKIHDKSADDPLFVNLHRVFAEKKIPELSFVGSHFLAKPPGIFQLAVIFWYGHILPSQSASPPALPKGEPSSVSNALHRTVHRSVPFICATNWILLISFYIQLFLGRSHCIHIRTQAYIYRLQQVHNIYRCLLFQVDNQDIFSHHQAV